MQRSPVESQQTISRKELYYTNHHQTICNKISTLNDLFCFVLYNCVRVPPGRVPQSRGAAALIPKSRAPCNNICNVIFVAKILEFQYRSIIDVMKRDPWKTLNHHLWLLHFDLIYEVPRHVEECWKLLNLYLWLADEWSLFYCWVYIQVLKRRFGKAFVLAKGRGRWEFRDWVMYYLIVG